MSLLSKAKAGGEKIQNIGLGVAGGGFLGYLAGRLLDLGGLEVAGAQVIGIGLVAAGTGWALHQLLA